MIEEIILTKEECDWILNSCGEFIRSGVTDNGIDVKITDYRTCYEYSFVDNVEISNFILSKLKKFNVISLPNTLSVIRYDAGQYFKNHTDYGVNQEYRYKSVSIQLSEYNEYNGGNLIIYLPSEDGILTSTCVHRKLGNMVMFDSKLNHEVEKIISGTRYVLVFWLKKEDFE